MWILPLLLILPPALVLWQFYNRLVRDQNLLREAWAGIEVQLKRRHDLIPRLVSCVRAYVDHERGLLSELTRLRADSDAQTRPDEKGRLEQQMTRQLRPLLGLAEAYPDLKAAGNFQELMTSLVTVEEDLQMARRYYNGCVRNLNNRVEGVPGIWIAPRLGVASAVYFEVESAVEREAPAVQLERT